MLNLDLTPKFSREATLDAGPNSSNVLLTLPKIEGLSRTYFLKLDLSDDSGRALSRNFYWLSTARDVNDFGNSSWYSTPITSYADFKELGKLPRARVELAASSRSHGGEEVTEVTVRI